MILCLHNINPHKMTRRLCQLEALLKEGAAVICERLGRASRRFNKGPRDFALQTDRDVEQLYAKRLNQLYPDIPVVGEELSPHQASARLPARFLALDPIDGTVNYSRSLPEFATSIALVENGTASLSGMYFPVLGEMYLAESGGGAWCNKTKLRVSTTNHINDAIVAVGDFSVADNDVGKNALRYELMKVLGDHALRVRMPGTAALQLAWLAAGRIDSSITLSNISWDVQAGVLMVREAGGKVFDGDGTAHTSLSQYTLGTNSRLKPIILSALAEAEGINTTSIVRNGPIHNYHVGHTVTGGHRHRDCRPKNTDRAFSTEL